MEANTAKALDRVILNLKRKRATRYAARPNGALQSVLPQWTSFISPTKKVVKRMRLGRYKSKPTNSGSNFGQSLVRYYLNYKKSGRPERLMFYRNGGWVDFPKDVVDLIKKDFEVKKAAVEVELNGHHLVLNFLHMYQMDLKTGLQQPIAWIDETGCCFFPEIYAASDEVPYDFCNEDAATSPHASASYCDVDENGVRHLVFCRVIMGNMELLRPGTRQFRPSSSEFDSGVDDIESPRYYIVWNMNMNTHIYPEFIVSFKVSSDAEGHLCGSDSKNNVSGVNSASQSPKSLFQSESSTIDTGIATSVVTSLQKAPKSPWMPFPMLFAAITSKVPPKDMELINIHYQQFRIPSQSSFILKDANNKKEV
ncbi:WWE domain [Sesbania bispinosa]|nr:WWE domain [Sesbania bispinosa]